MASNSRRPSLPSFALEYSKIHPNHALAVQRFHVWLVRSYRPLKQLTIDELQRYLAIVASLPLSKSTRTRYRLSTLRYFDWLHQHQLLPHSANALDTTFAAALPPLALRFVATLQPTLKASTVGSYRSCLQQFHTWLAARNQSLHQLTREDLDAWLHWLFDRGLQPQSRTHHIVQLRTYFSWLVEQNELTLPAEVLLRSSDLPKRPQYLPRPLPPDIDALLKKRLRTSRNSLQLALLLMRNTGLRVGELIRLSHRCVRIDLHGNSLLKVPLGKLDNERLVPLDPKTLRLVRRLQRNGSGHRPFLLQYRGKLVRYDMMRAALLEACKGLSTPEPITTHRLRHTYATTLLAGGMSLVAIMRLLGHRDYRMTLRYAAITDEAVITEYTAALERNSQRYAPPASTSAPSGTDPLAQLSDLIRLVKNRSQDAGLDPDRTHLLLKRIRRLQAQVKRHFNVRKPCSFRAN
jgi:site-specific recombinase XerD